MASSKVWLGIASVALLSGCAESGTLRVDSQLSETSASLTAPEETTLTLGDGKLVVNRARIVVSEIELEGGEEEEREAELGWANLEIALNGEPTNVVADSVEAGSYHTVGLEFRGGNDGILIEGTYGGAPFVFQSGWAPEAEFPIEPELFVPPNREATVGVTFDVAAWFTRPDGTVIDPLDGANHAAIDNNIMASIGAQAEIEIGDDDD